MLIIFWKEFWILSEPDKISPALAMTRMPLICCLWLRDVSGSCTEAFRALCPVLRPREGAKSEWTCRICDQGALDSLSIQNPIQREGKTPEMGRGCAARGGSRAWDGLAGWFTGTQGQPKSGEMPGPEGPGVSILTKDHLPWPTPRPPEVLQN